MGNQISYRINTTGERDRGVNRPGGHDLSPRHLRIAEVDLAQLATEHSLRALHGIHIAVAAGAVAGAEQMQPPAVQDWATVPASPEVQRHAAAIGQPIVPPSAEVQQFAAAQAQQPMPVQAQGF